MSLVSVIVPGYNHAPFLQQRLDSILAQTYTDYELILLDDASTDGSDDILRAFAATHPEARLVINSENSGSAFRQWAKGLAMATGRYVWIAESDDAAHPEFLQTMVELLQQEPDMVMAYSASLYMDTDGQMKEPVMDWYRHLDSLHWEQDFVADGKAEVQQWFTVCNVVPNTSAVVFRKDAVTADDLEAIVPYRFAGDWLFWGRLLLRGRLGYCARPLNYYRRHEGTTRVYKPIGSERQRIRECVRVIRLLSRLSGRPRPWFHATRHRWITDAWLRRYYAYRPHPGYLFPPLPAALLPGFYRGVWRNVVGAVGRRVTSLRGAKTR